MYLSKLTLALSIMGTGLAFAGTMGPVCSPGNVTVPCTQNSWGINASALYLQSSYSGALGYLGVRDPLALTQDHVKKNPEWSWGFQLGASYYFNTGNDVSVNWYHLINHSTSRDASYSFDAPLALQSFLSDAASVQPSWDSVNFEVGQLVNMSVSNAIRFHAGAQYSRIATTLTHFNYIVKPLNDYDRDDLQYSGFGPRLGADLSYFVTADFSVYAKPATAVLVGSSKTNSVRGDFNSPQVIYLSRTQVVPEVDLKLGLQYDYALTSSKISADVGYMWVNYFSPISQVEPLLTNLETGNFALQGLYFGLKWAGSV